MNIIVFYILQIGPNDAPPIYYAHLKLGSSPACFVCEEARAPSPDFKSLPFCQFTIKSVTVKTRYHAPGNTFFTRLHFLDVDFQWKILLYRKLNQGYSTPGPTTKANFGIHIPTIQKNWRCCGIAKSLLPIHDQRSVRPPLHRSYKFDGSRSKFY